MPCPAMSSRKYCATKRLPTSRPYMSGKTAMTVSISPSAMRRFSSSSVMRPCMIGYAVTRLRGYAAAERHHRDHRSEDLLAHDRHLRLHVDEDRRLEIRVAADVASRGQRRAFAASCFDVLHHALTMARGDERTHLRFIRQRLADLHRF